MTAHEERQRNTDDAAALEVNELTASMSGRWLVTTRGSQHIWDLDLLLYERLPGEDRQSFAYDSEPHRITRVGVFPRVGAGSVVYFDDPEDDLVEHYHVSSTIRRIERLATGDGAGGI